MRLQKQLELTMLLLLLAVDSSKGLNPVRPQQNIHRSQMLINLAQAKTEGKQKQTQDYPDDDDSWNSPWEDEPEETYPQEPVQQPLPPPPPPVQRPQPVQKPYQWPQDGPDYWPQETFYWPQDKPWPKDPPASWPKDKPWPRQRPANIPTKPVPRRKRPAPVKKTPPPPPKKQEPKYPPPPPGYEYDPDFPGIPLPILDLPHNWPMWEDPPEIWFDLPPWWYLPVLFPEDYLPIKWPKDIPMDPNDPNFRIPPGWPLDYNDPLKPWFPNPSEPLRWPRDDPLDPSDPNFYWPEGWPRSPSNPKMPYFPKCPTRDPRFRYPPDGPPILLKEFDYPTWPFGSDTIQYWHSPFVPKKPKKQYNKPPKIGHKEQKKSPHRRKPEKKGFSPHKPVVKVQSHPPIFNFQRGRPAVKPPKIGHGPYRVHARVAPPPPNHQWLQSRPLLGKKPEKIGHGPKHLKSGINPQSHSDPRNSQPVRRSRNKPQKMGIHPHGRVQGGHSFGRMPDSHPNNASNKGVKPGKYGRHPNA